MAGTTLPKRSVVHARFNEDEALERVVHFEQDSGPLLAIR